jgi:transcriptional regulator with XRE-family HTH domain
MNKLSELLRKRMDTEGLSERDAGKRIGVSHATVARAVNGETVEVDTLVKISQFLGVPVENVLDVKEKPSELEEQIMMVLSIEPELAQVFSELAEKIVNQKIDKKVLSEVAAFAAYRLQILTKEESKVDEQVEI